MGNDGKKIAYAGEKWSDETDQNKKEQGNHGKPDIPD
jgi:hypothetical protein